ncbi:efflux RND transporter periplasmic adaptor subunit [Shewanella sp. SR44-3]|uniref:efflux RND transporter periplasmic adaptor subunit n=1 Tax=unclassified Shewanella TaxID=196818 RepID=UPI0015F84EED|nr:efflux RND transporter periplasmic adaptor subunit [Shewanella sp. SR44-3]MBB1270564.1 efflux RND transporter periplasmic adaptor subunit [Shewanella sp. SR44-3]
MPATKIRSGFRLISLITLAALLWGCEKAQSETGVDASTPVKLMEIPQLKSTKTHQFVAQVSASKQAQLAFQVPGEIAMLEVRMGQDIKQGQLLAKLDQQDYLLALAAMQANFELQQARLKRARQLFEKHLVSEDSLDQTQTAYTEAQLNLQQAQTDLSYTELHAPFSGVISITHAKTYQFVDAKQAVVSMLNNQDFDIDFSLPVHLTTELNIDNLKHSNLKVRLSRFDNLLLPASFKEISTKPDADTNSYKVTLTISRPPSLNILSGMSGMVHIEQALTEQLGLMLPLGAIYSQRNGQAQIWRMNETSQLLEAVSVLLDADDRIVSGITPGDKIVIAGAKNLKAGQRVRPWVKEGGI